MKNSHKIFVGNLEGRRDHLGDVVIVFLDNTELGLSEILYKTFENIG